MMAAKPWTEWCICGIFTNRDRDHLIRQAVTHYQAVAGLDQVVYLRAKKRRAETPLFEPAFFLEDMSSKRSNNFLRVNEAVAGGRAVLVIDDVETIRHYPQSMTRNIINHIAPLARYKVIAGGVLVVNKLDDLYAPFAVLDKRVIYANHYWAFIEDHREVSVFDGRTILGNKNMPYLAAKLKPFIRFDLDPELGNRTQEALYEAIRQAPIQQRVQDVSELRL